MHSRIKRLKLILRLQLSTLEVRQTNPVLCANVRISWFSSSGMKLVKLASEGLQAWLELESRTLEVQLT